MLDTMFCRALFSLRCVADRGNHGRRLRGMQSVSERVQPTTSSPAQSIFKNGLAGWQDQVFGFNNAGEVIDIDPLTGDVNLIANTAHAWAGAGVFSILPE